VYHVSQVYKHLFVVNLLCAVLAVNVAFLALSHIHFHYV